MSGLMMPVMTFIGNFGYVAVCVVGAALAMNGSISFGVIEQIRRARPEARYLELVHRLDKDTSGLLMIAKKRSALVKLHEAIRNDHPKKIYLALGVGKFAQDKVHVKLPLYKYTGAQGEKWCA